MVSCYPGGNSAPGRHQHHHGRPDEFQHRREGGAGRLRRPTGARRHWLGMSTQEWSNTLGLPQH
jgi:hypothetical protein